MRNAIQAAFLAMAEADTTKYVRGRDLPRLIAVWPKELNDHSIPGTEQIIARIQKPLRATYRQALEGHWSYSISRHIALLSALKAEQACLARLIRERQAACMEAAE